MDRGYWASLIHNRKKKRHKKGGIRMAYIQKSVPPPNKIIPFNVLNFNGGINNRSTLLQDNESSYLLNMIWYGDTVLEKRKGSKYYDELTLSGSLIHVDEFKPYTAPDVMMRADATQLYAGNTSISTLSGEIEGLTFQGKYFFVDGDSVRVYGKFPQATSTYERVEGVPDASYRVMTVVATPSGYVPLDTSHKRGVTVYDYTNNTIHYEPCSLEQTDPYLGLSVPPENPSLIVTHQGRLYVSGDKTDDDNVFLTAPNNPYYFAVGLPLQVPPNSDKIVGLAVYDDSVLVGRKESVFVITGDTNNPDLGMEMFRIRKLNTHTGFASKRSFDVAHNFFFFLGNDGNAYVLSSARQDERILSTTILTNTIDFRLTPYSLFDSDFEGAFSVFHKDYWYLNIGAYTFIYSYRHRAWTVWEGLRATCFYCMGEELVWGCENGRIGTFSQDFTDYGMPYRQVWHSKTFDMGEPATYKQLRDFYIVAHTFSGFQSNVYVSFEVDYETVDSDVVIDNQLAVWGSTRWGDVLYENEVNTTHPFTIGRRARNIKIQYSNGYRYLGEYADMVAMNAIIRKERFMACLNQSDNQLYSWDGDAWVLIQLKDYNQPIRIYQINGEYELRGKR